MPAAIFASVLIVEAVTLKSGNVRVDSHGSLTMVTLAAECFLAGMYPGQTAAELISFSIAHRFSVSFSSEELCRVFPRGLFQRTKEGTAAQQAYVDVASKNERRQQRSNNKSNPNSFETIYFVLVNVFRCADGPHSYMQAGQQHRAHSIPFPGWHGCAKRHSRVLARTMGDCRNVRG